MKLRPEDRGQPPLNNRPLLLIYPINCLHVLLKLPKFNILVKSQYSSSSSCNIISNKLESHKIGQKISCKAAVVYGPCEPLVIEEIMVDPPQEMEVRIKIIFTSICHTDLSAWQGKNEAQQAFPRILGHEASGIIESVGGGVTDLKAGDHVIPIFNGECGNCIYCKSRDTNLCGKYRLNPFKSVMVNDGKCRFSTKDEKPIYHFLNTSTFSEYTVIDSACVVKIDPKAPLDKMALLSCCISTGVGAVWNTAKVRPGSSVAVFGLGAAGLAVVEGARAMGASKIVGIDVNPDKQIKGQTIGLTASINPKLIDTPVHEKVREIIEGGVDYSFECAGNLDVLREAFLSTHDGWGLTIVLGVHPTPRLLPLRPMELFNGRKIVAAIFSDFKGKSQLPNFAKQCMQGVVRLEEFITHDLPFEKINDAFQLLIEGKSLRCILHV